MSIRPIDIVTIAPKSQEASQMHYNDLRGRTHAENAASQNFQRAEAHDSHRTVETAKSDTKEYKFDAKEGSGNSYSGGGHKKKKSSDSHDEKEKKRSDSPFSSGFDITV